MAGNIITVNEQDTFEKQYGKLKINIADKFHDRFMILDNKVMYHVGASIKDAGKKVFAISVIDDMEQ